MELWKIILVAVGFIVAVVVSVNFGARKMDEAGREDFTLYKKTVAEILKAIIEGNTETGDHFILATRADTLMNVNEHFLSLVEDLNIPDTEALKLANGYITMIKELKDAKPSEELRIAWKKTIEDTERLYQTLTQTVEAPEVENVKESH